MTSYKQSGVDKEVGYSVVENIKENVKNTHSSRVLNGLGDFGSLYHLAGYKNPVLVSGTDGVGTKLLLSKKFSRWNTIGQDCFAMCANDILCHGAKPLFFLDYLACGKLEPEIATTIINGLAEVCKINDTALVGGETAEMPGMYKGGDYDIAGFCVGVVEHDKMIDCSQISKGDSILALPSSGVHSNGFSLIRKIFIDFEEKIGDKSLFEILLTPTKVYVKPVLRILEKFTVKGLAHITGGGMIENIPRILPKNLCAEINFQAIPKQEIFKLIEQKGVSKREMQATFNMGVGFVLVVDPKEKDPIIHVFQEMGEKPFELGKIISHPQKIIIQG